MHKLARFVLVLALSLPLTGCGGCTDSADDIKRSARVRFPDELESAPDPAAKTAVAPAAGAPASAPSQGPRPAKTAKIEAAGSSPAAAQPQQVKPKEVPVLFAFAPATVMPESDGVTVVVDNAKPAKLPTPREIRTRTLKNLTRIGKAINDYVDRYGQFPPRAIRNDSGDFGLSWRVAILPQLGYESLYIQFRLYESWDSPHNKQLLAQIPPEFQSPDRFDTSTNYLAVASRDSVFLRSEPIAPLAIIDGLQNTIMIVEADDSHAVAWSRPADLVVAHDNPLKGLGSLRGDGFLCLMADGKVLRGPPTMLGIRLLSLITCQGEESIKAESTLLAPTLVPPTVANAAAVDAAGHETAVTEPASDAPPATATSLQDVEKSGPPPVPKLSVPDEIATAKSRELLKDLYGDQVSAATKPEDRVKLVREMLADASEMEANPADYYELLRIVRDIAGTCGDVATALQAIQLLEEKFQIDGLAMRLKSLEELGKFGQKPEVAKALPEMAKDVLILCIDRDDYDAAQKVAEHLLALARAARNGGDVQRASQTVSASVLRGRLITRFRSRSSAWKATPRTPSPMRPSASTCA